jgi:type 1 fimbriae regulatory protein FimB/type 1 fimbriae regulatory protein FimE
MTIRTVHYIVAQAGKAAGIDFPVHPHMLRHATGFYLANAGQDTRSIQLYLGHKNIQHTVRYTELSPQGFKDFWKDCTSLWKESQNGQLPGKEEVHGDM